MSKNLFLYSHVNNLPSDSLVIQWRFVNRVQKQMNAFLEVFMCNNTVATWGQCDHRLWVDVYLNLNLFLQCLLLSKLSNTSVI